MQCLSPEGPSNDGLDSFKSLRNWSGPSRDGGSRDRPHPRFTGTLSETTRVDDRCVQKKLHVKETPVPDDFGGHLPEVCV